MTGNAATSRGPEASPLVNSSVNGTVVQVLNGHSYALNPSRQSPNPLTLSTALFKGAKVVTILALSPLLLAGSIMLSSIMLVAPKKIQKKISSLFLPIICSKLNMKFAPERKALLAHLHGDGGGGKVLDVGSGTGEYIRYLADASQVVALEPVPELHASIERQAKLWLSPKEIPFAVFGITLETYLKHYPEEAGTFDWIILGNVLCEVGNVKEALMSVDCALKEGGYVYFSEHIGCPCGSWKRSIQNLLNPWWKVFSSGCNLNRDTLLAIQSMPHWQVISWDFPHLTVGLGSSFVLGLAQKKKTEEKVYL